MNDEIKKLMKELLKSKFPITRVRIPNTKHGGIRTKGNFNRAITIGDNVYVMSNYNQRQLAMHTLTSIISRTFNTP